MSSVDDLGRLYGGSMKGNTLFTPGFTSFDIAKFKKVVVVVNANNFVSYTDVHQTQNAEIQIKDLSNLSSRILMMFIHDFTVAFRKHQGKVDHLTIPCQVGISGQVMIPNFFPRSSDMKTVFVYLVSLQTHILRVGGVKVIKSIDSTGNLLLDKSSNTPIGDFVELDTVYLCC